MEVVHSGITGQAREESMPSQLCVCQRICRDSSVCFEPDTFIQSLVNRCCKRNHLRNTFKKSRASARRWWVLVLKCLQMELQGAGHQAALGRWAGNPLPLPPFLFPLPLLLCGLCTHWVPALHILENLKRLSFSLAMMEWLGSKQLCLLKTISHVLFFCSLFLFFKFIFNWRIIDLQHCLAYHSVNQP